MQRLPVFEPYLLGNEAEYIKRALDEKNISGTSPTIDQFERALARFFEVPHAVALANGTAALHVAVEALGVKPGDEVLVPDFTIISNAIGIVLGGATPVFVDVSEKDWCLDVTKLESALTHKTVGVMAVHMYGNACDMDALVAFCKKHNLWLIEDAAQAQGATWRGKQLGSFGDVATYSFYANKLITTGEGGAITCKDRLVKEKALQIRNLGFDPSPERRFIHSMLTNNYRMSSLQAAMGLAQIEGAPRLLAERTRVRDLYQQRLSEVRGITLAEPPPHCLPSFWMSTLLVDEGGVSVDLLGRRLRDLGIETRRFFYPLHRQPCLEKHHRQGSQAFPVSDALFERGIYLPSSSLLTRAQVDYVVDSLEESLRRE